MTRVLVLRLLLAFLTVALVWAGTRILAGRLSLPEPFASACLFAVLSGQMFYAVTCRIASDALTIPWLLFFLVAVIRSLEVPGWRRTAIAAAILGVGLLIKSSLLVFVPLAFAAPVATLIERRSALGKAALGALISAVVIGALAGPWYVRNLLLYRSLSANVDATGGVGPLQMIRDVAALPWLDTAVYTAHSALWTGNNSFTTFSHSTVNVMLGLLGVASVLFCLLECAEGRRKRSS